MSPVFPLPTAARSVRPHDAKAATRLARELAIPAPLARVLAARGVLTPDEARYMVDWVLKGAIN